MKKVLIFLTVILFFNVNAFAETVDDAIGEIPVEDFEKYINNNNPYFKDNNINVKDLIKNVFKGELHISLRDYLLYEMKNEQGFFKDILKTGINILVVSMLLIIIKYFSDELMGQSVSDIVVIFSAIIIFTIILKDVLSIKNMMSADFSKFKTITEEINAVFMASMLTFGKLSVLQFFYTSLNYAVGVTTQFVYRFTDIMTIILIAVILINNMGKLIKAELLYKLLKKATLLILSAYMIIVVINFSVQGYILYKTDNIFVSSIKALSPSAAPVIGNAVNSFFGVFFKSILMIKDVLGIVVIVFIFSAFGGSLIKIAAALVIYKAVGVLAEPFNENISKLIYEMADIFYIYLICMITPIIIVTVYYSILLKYMNNIFG
jgi:stage III sporulation protein AE